jgi:hypothetical protein
MSLHKVDPKAMGCRFETKEMMKLRLKTRIIKKNCYQQG